MSKVLKASVYHCVPIRVIAVVGVATARKELSRHR